MFGRHWDSENIPPDVGGKTKVATKRELERIVNDRTCFTLSTMLNDLFKSPDVWLNKALSAC